MSVTGKRGIGIPVILLHGSIRFLLKFYCDIHLFVVDAEGAVVSIELKNGAVYRGILTDTQDNMNCTITVSIPWFNSRRLCENTAYIEL